MIQIPNKCPVCESTLEKVKDQLYCRNNSCDAKTSKQLLHFIKTMKIKGLGEKTLEKLEITSIHQLYALEESSMKSTLGEKIGVKLYQEIQSSKSTSLRIFIQSFGITLIGNSASSKLAPLTDSLWSINKEICSVAGLGAKATEYLLEWINKNRSIYSDLPITMLVEQQPEKVQELFKVVITGKLKDFASRTKAKDFLVERGVTVMSGVSSKVNYLICDQEDSTSSSISKANKLNIPVKTMKDFLTYINGDFND